ncbi:MAG: MMPL family transporter [Deltaproteobacteria bacterium]|nr:MMPL family transporter [Deltaproteobacteria bacterium]
MERFVEGVLRRRLWVLAAIGLLSGLSLLSLTRAVIASSVAELFLGESAEYQAFLEQARTFGNDEIGVFILPAKGILEPEGREALARATGAIESMPEVARVLSILDVQSIRSDDDDLVVESRVDRIESAGLGGAEALAELEDEPLVRGTLLSRDGNHTAVVVELRTDGQRAAERLDLYIRQMLDAFVDAGFPREEIRRAGAIVVMSEVIVQTLYSVRGIFPISAVVLLFAVWALFRRLWPSMLSLGIALVAVLWTMGLAVAIDPQVNILMATVPAVILIVSFSDVVHLCSAYLLELERGLEKDAAIRQAAADVGRACLYTSLTTFVGFVSLSLIPTKAFRQLGLILGFGVAVALLLAVTLAPIAFHLLPQPKALRAGTTGRVQGLLDGVLAAVQRLVLRFPLPTALAFGVLFLACVASLFTLHLETRFSDRLAPRNQVRQDHHFLIDHFGGSNIMELYLEAPEVDGLLEPAVMQGVAALAAEARALPEVSAVFSLVDLMEQLHRSLDPGAKGALPATREALAQYLLLFEMSGGEELERLVDADRRKMHLTVRLPDEGFRSTAEVGRKLEEAGRRLIPEEVRVWATGHTLLFGMWLDDVIAGQRRGLGLSLAVIAFMMIISVRSLRMGLWSMIPNVLPLLALGGYLALTTAAVDTDLMMVAMLAIGIGVDDTIHFLTRYCIERERGASREQAIENTFHFAGRAIVMTTVILVVGFAPFASSQYLSTRVMGTLLPMVLGVALVADLVLVPALLKLGVMERGVDRKGDAIRAGREP